MCTKRRCRIVSLYTSTSFGEKLRTNKSLQQLHWFIYWVKRYFTFPPNLKNKSGIETVRLTILDCRSWYFVGIGICIHDLPWLIDSSNVIFHSFSHTLSILFDASLIAFIIFFCFNDVVVVCRFFFFLLLLLFSWVY